MSFVLRWTSIAWLYSLLSLQGYHRLWPQLWLQPIWVWSLVYALIPAIGVAGLGWAFARDRREHSPVWAYLLLVNGLALLLITWIHLGPPVAH